MHFMRWISELPILKIKKQETETTFHSKWVAELEPKLSAFFDTCLHGSCFRDSESVEGTGQRGIKLNWAKELFWVKTFNLWHWLGLRALNHSLLILTADEKQLMGNILSFFFSSLILFHTSQSLSLNGMVEATWRVLPPSEETYLIWCSLKTACCNSCPYLAP